MLCALLKSAKEAPVRTHEEVSSGGCVSSACLS